MAAAIIPATEGFVREQFAHAIDEHRPIGPVAKAILEALLTEIAT